MPVFLFIFNIFLYALIKSHSYIHPSPFADVIDYLLIAGKLSGEKPPWGVKPRIELAPAVQQAHYAKAHPSEPQKNRTDSKYISGVQLLF